MRRTTVVLTLTLLLGGSAGLAAQAPDSTAGPDAEEDVGVVCKDDPGGEK